ncbi:MAG: DUF4190 domain-containing protein [Pseudobutyrivibrio sp.]|nr:DUF4190 domain-containing protein [Pseudobutyrivibrio sp.]
MFEDYMFEEEENIGYTGPEYSNVQLERKAAYRRPVNNKPEDRETIGIAIGSFVLGVLSLVFFLIGINFISAIISIVLGIIYLVSSKEKRGKGLAITGIVTSILGMVLCIAAWAFIFSNAANIRVLTNDVEGMEKWYEYYGIEGDDYYEESPFDQDEFDINDSL